MTKGTQVNLRFQPKSWHYKQLEELSEMTGLAVTQIARDLLMAAIEQTSDNPPARQQPVHLQKFDEGAK